MNYIFKIISYTFLHLTIFSIPSYLYASFSEDEDRNKETVNILSIDGGGIRGVLPARILQHIEQELEKNFNRKIPIAECFDIIAGTSTGGIISLGLNMRDSETNQLYTAKKLVELYKDKGKDIFPWAKFEWVKKLNNLVSAAYKVEPLENVLDTYFNDTLLKEAYKRVLIPSYEMHGNKMFLFDSKNSLASEFKFKEVARATSAAPTYFPAARFTKKGENYGFIDAGIYANNPALIAYEKALEIYPKAKKFFILSLGTGETPQDNLYTNLEKAGQITWAPYIPQFMMQSATDIVDQTLRKQKLLHERMQGSYKYIRVQAKVSQIQAALDNTKQETIDGLIGVANKIAEEETLPIINYLTEYLEHSIGYAQAKDVGNTHVKTLNILINSARGNLLDLGGKEVTPQDIAGTIKRALFGNQDITSLILQNNKLGFEAIKPLGELLRQNTNILRLNLDHNNFCDKVELFSKWFEGSNLQELSLKYCKLNDKDVIDLPTLFKKVPSIASVKIKGSNVSKDSTYDILRQFIADGRILLED